MHIEIQFLDFANNCLFDNMFWVDEITISAKKNNLNKLSTTIFFFLICPINHC